LCYRVRLRNQVFIKHITATPKSSYTRIVQQLMPGRMIAYLLNLRYINGRCNPHWHLDKVVQCRMYIITPASKRQSKSPLTRPNTLSNRTLSSSSSSERIPVMPAIPEAREAATSIPRDSTPSFSVPTSHHSLRKSSRPRSAAASCPLPPVAPIRPHRIGRH
jgi:hypothetical protein